MSTAGAAAAANDATVTTGGPSDFDPVADAQRNVKAAKLKVKRQQEHLAGAKRAVVDAEAALADAKKG